MRKKRSLCALYAFGESTCGLSFHIVTLSRMSCQPPMADRWRLEHGLYALAWMHTTHTLILRCSLAQLLSKYANRIGEMRVRHERIVPAKARSCPINENIFDTHHSVFFFIGLLCMRLTSIWIEHNHTKICSTLISKILCRQAGKKCRAMCVC